MFPRVSPSLLATTFAALLAVVVAAEGQTSPPGVILSAASQVAGNVTSTGQVNLLPAPALLRCTFLQTAHGGNVSATYKIQAADEGVPTVYYDMLAAATATPTDNVPIPLYIGPGIVAANNLAANVPLPALWRAIVTIGGNTTPTSAFTVHCRAQ